MPASVTKLKQDISNDCSLEQPSASLPRPASVTRLYQNNCRLFTKDPILNFQLRCNSLGMARRLIEVFPEAARGMASIQIE